MTDNEWLNEDTLPEPAAYNQPHRVAGPCPAVLSVCILGLLLQCVEVIITIQVIQLQNMFTSHLTSDIKTTTYRRKAHLEQLPKDTRKRITIIVIRVLI
jgi:hypothetical protein